MVGGGPEGSNVERFPTLGSLLPNLQDAVERGESLEEEFREHITNMEETTTEEDGREKIDQIVNARVSLDHLRDLVRESKEVMEEIGRVQQDSTRSGELGPLTSAAMKTYRELQHAFLEAENLTSLLPPPHSLID